MPQRAEIGCQWQQSEGEDHLLGCGLDLERLSFWHCSHQEFPNELMFKPSSAAAAALAPSCWHVQEKALSSSDILLYSLPMVCMSHMELPWVLVQQLGIALGGVAENFLKEGRKENTSSFYFCC